MPVLDLFTIVLALSMLELLFIGCAIVGVIVSVRYDRSTASQSMFLAVGVVAVVFYAMNRWAGCFPNINVHDIFNLGLVKTFGGFLFIGVLYSIIEFVFGIRTAKVRVKADFNEYVEQLSDAQRELLIQNQQIPCVFSSDPDRYKAIERLLNTFGVRYLKSYSNTLDTAPYLMFGATENLELTPSIDKDTLASCVLNWTFFWPAHAVFRLFGDVLFDVFSNISRLFIACAERFIKASFKNSFKI